MSTRTASMALALAVLVGALAGCTPSPEPSAEPTPVFSSEAEAFAAAEETYRAYVDALNEVDLADPETFEDLYGWTTGEANADDRTTFSQMHADGWVVSGTSIATRVEPRSLGGSDADEVELAVCLDVSNVELKDAAGNSVVSADRPAAQSMLVALEPSTSTSTNWVISSFSGRDGEPQCD